MDWFEENQVKESRFNIGLLFLEHIQRNIAECNDFSRSGMMRQWFQTLKIIHRKAQARLLKIKEDDFVKTLEKLRGEASKAELAYQNKMSDVQEAQNQAKMGKKNIPRLSVGKERAECFRALETYEEKLLIGLDKCGWLVPEKKSGLDAAGVM